MDNNLFEYEMKEENITADQTGFASIGDEDIDFEVTEELVYNPLMCSHINVLQGSIPKLTTQTSARGSHCSSCKSTTVQEVLEKYDEKSADSSNWESDSSWPDVDIPGTWGTHGLEHIPWDNDTKPCVTFRKFQEVELDEIEQRGVLTDRIIATASSYLDKSAEYQKFIFCKVDLSNKLLADISILKYHHYLQYVNLKKNELTEVEALGQLPFLMYLDVSYNFLTKLLDFKAPFNLTYVDYSNNRLQTIDDLSDFWSIVNLDLSSNRINTIQGLNGLKYLRHLNLSKNVLVCIENLSHLKLLTLNLNSNNLYRFEEGEDVGFKTLIDILYVDVGNNNLTSLKLFQRAANIQSINVENNRIDDLMEMVYLRELNFLTEAIFEGNPIFENKMYVESCIFNIPHLFVLDRMFMDASKKALTMNSFNSFPRIDSMRKSANLLFLQQINDPMLGSFVIPSDRAPSPIIILVGPPGSKKGETVMNFVKSHRKHTVLGVSHTTRIMNDDEKHGENYYFVSNRDFNTMASSGQFLTVSSSFGNSFALAETEISKTMGNKAALVLHMDLTSALTLRAKGYRCILILAMPDTSETHKSWLTDKYYNYSLTPKYRGAVVVQNWPSKAKQYLTQFENFETYSGTCFAQDVLHEIVKKATRPTNGGSEGSSSETTSDSEKDDLSFQALGILKRCSSNPSKSTSINLPRASVTFDKYHEVGEEKESSRRPQMSRVHSIRSVTFSEIQPPQFELTERNSASKTLLNGNMESGVNFLSVLSHSHLKERIKCDCADFDVWKSRVQAYEAFVGEVLKSRALYLEVHQTNPGLFTDVIFTNNAQNAYERLKRLLKDAISNQQNVKSHFAFKKDAVYQSMLATRLQGFHKEIKSYMSVTQTQLDAMGKVAEEHTLISEQKHSQKNMVEVMRKYHHQAVSYKLPSDTKYVRKQSKEESVQSY